MVTAYIENINKYKDEYLFRDSYFTLPEYRRNKIDRLSGEVSRRQSLSAGLLLKRGLFHVGIDDDAVYTSYTRFGKPIGRAGDHFDFDAEASGIKGGTDIYFSLSHSGGYAMCAISDGKVGCDIEAYSDRDIRIAKRALSTAGYEEYKAIPTDPEKPSGEDRKKQREYFFGAWTIKESYMKAEGTGFLISPSKINLNKKSQIVFIEGKDTYHFYSDRTSVSGYVFSICTKSKEVPRIVFL